MISQSKLVSVYLFLGALENTVDSNKIIYETNVRLVSCGQSLVDFFQILITSSGICFIASIWFGCAELEISIGEIFHHLAQAEKFPRIPSGMQSKKERGLCHPTDLHSFN